VRAGAALLTLQPDGYMYTPERLALGGKTISMHPCIFIPSVIVHTFHSVELSVIGFSKRSMPGSANEHRKTSIKLCSA
jgi:hypothetical protein